MRRFWVSLLGILMLGTVASAATINLTSSNSLNPAVTVSVTITDIAGGVRIVANVNPAVAGAQGDLIGLYFNYDGIAPADGSATTTVNSYTDGNGDPDDPGAVYDNVSGGKAGPFDLGTNAFHFMIGENGIGNNKYDISMISFDATSSPALVASKFLSAVGRVTSVTEYNGNGQPSGRGGSLWLTNSDYPEIPDTETQVPEPAAWLMMTAGLALVGLAKARRFAGR